MKLETSFFSQAFAMLSFLGAYFVFLTIPDKYWPQLRLWVYRTFGYIVIIAAFIVILSISLSESVIVVKLTNILGTPMPETVLLLTQGLALVFYTKSGLTKTILFSLLAALTVLTFKNTAILILLVICVGLYMFPQNRLRKFSVVTALGLGFIALLALLLVGGAYLMMRSQYSDGNMAFRIRLWKYQIQQFLASPLYGSLFTSETAILASSRAKVPTHNDWLDVLAQGGMIGLTLFTGIFIRASQLLIRTRRKTIQSDAVTSRLASWLLLFMITVVVSFSFNPILGSPDIAPIIWVALAFAHRVAKPLHLPQATRSIGSSS
jgi:O-antigen ligase